MSSVPSVSDDSFQKEVLESEVPVLVDFWATWCAPCRALAPKVEELHQEYQGKVKVVKMDVDSNESTPSQFGIRGIPTLILFRNGEVVQTLMGNQPKDVIESAIKKVIP